MESKGIIRLNPHSSYFQTATGSFVVQPLPDGELINSRFLKLRLGKYEVPKTKFVQVACRFWGHPDEPSLISLPFEAESLDSNCYHCPI